MSSIVSMRPGIQPNSTSDHEVPADLGTQNFDFALSHQLTSMLYHDLVSSLTALLTGLDLMNDHAQSREIVALLQNSAQSMRSMLVLFRFMFCNNGSITLEDIATEIAGYHTFMPKVQVDFACSEKEPLPHYVVQALVFILSMIFYESNRRARISCVRSESKAMHVHMKDAGNYPSEPKSWPLDSEKTPQEDRRHQLIDWALSSLCNTSHMTVTRTILSAEHVLFSMRW